MDERTRVLIADDCLCARNSLRALLATWPGVEIVCVAEDGYQAAEMTGKLSPDVVLLDVQMPVWDGLRATRYIKSRWPETRVVLLTINMAHRAEAMSAGADKFLLKGCAAEELYEAVQCCGRPVDGPLACMEARENSQPTRRLEMASGKKLTAVALTA